MAGGSSRVRAQQAHLSGTLPPSSPTHLRASCKMGLGSMLCSSALSTPALATSMMGSCALPSSMISTCAWRQGQGGQQRIP